MVVSQLTELVTCVHILCGPELIANGWVQVRMSFLMTVWLRIVWHICVLLSGNAEFKYHNRLCTMLWLCFCVMHMHRCYYHSIHTKVENVMNKQFSRKHNDVNHLMRIESM